MPCFTVLVTRVEVLSVTDKERVDWLHQERSFARNDP
jgi:hypothetical protein